MTACATYDEPEHESQVSFHANEGSGEIGQLCSFGWPRSPGADGSMVTNFDDYPVCAPLQQIGGEVTLNNQACPVSCFQMPSLECYALICAATQIEGDGIHMNIHMNGQCWEVEGEQAPRIRCAGYCTKECRSDAGCPWGYRCTHMASPFFGEVLACEDEDLWGTECTSDCVPQGQSPEGTGVTCPSSREEDPDYDYGLCNLKEYSRCCACICYKFCPVLNMKFCRKTAWDREMFPGGVTEADDCF